MSLSGKKAILFTYHHWSSRRLGGFHKFAEALCRAGCDVLFVTFPRPWFGLLKRTERENARLLLRLLKGETWEIGGGRLTNVCLPTLCAPGVIGRRLPDSLQTRLLTSTVPSLPRWTSRFFPKADFLVFESTAAVLKFDPIRAAYPGSTCVYRPSDPLIAAYASPSLHAAERHVLESCDRILLVDGAAWESYREAFPGIESVEARVRILPNGVDLEPFAALASAQPGPDDEVTYIGAHAPDWQAILSTARELPHLRFGIVCPERPPAQVKRKLDASPNVVLHGGVPPSKVVEHIARASVLIVPYPASMRSGKWLGLTAKYMQAMAAHRPIVTLNTNPALAAHGITVCGDSGEFTRAIARAVEEGRRRYSFPLADFDWSTLQRRFLDELVSAREDAT